MQSIITKECGIELISTLLLTPQNTVLCAVSFDLLGTCQWQVLHFLFFQARGWGKI